MMYGETDTKSERDEAAVASTCSRELWRRSGAGLTEPSAGGPLGPESVALATAGVPHQQSHPAAGRHDYLPAPSTVLCQKV